LNFVPTQCDGNQANANLRTEIDSPPGGTRGEAFTKDFTINNHGPGNANNVTFSANIPNNAFLESFTPSQGACNFDGKKLTCNFGNLLDDGTAGVQLNLIPLKAGTLKTTFNVNADNMGKVFAKKTTVKTPIAAGNNAILNVTMGCKKAGTGGTVTISPDSNGGTTTCTCPDPNSNPPLKDFLCAIESYATQTVVTLTETPTIGQFDKWLKDCKGQPAPSCMLTLDPAAPNPGKTARALFKP
jgi:hypothetical protein